MTPGQLPGRQRNFNAIIIVPHSANNLDLECSYFPESPAGDFGLVRPRAEDPVNLFLSLKTYDLQNCEIIKSFSVLLVCHATVENKCTQ